MHLGVAGAGCFAEADLGAVSQLLPEGIGEDDPPSLLVCATRFGGRHAVDTCARPFTLEREPFESVAQPVPQIVQFSAVVASAVCYAAAFPPGAHRTFAWIALVPFLIVLRHTTLRRGILLAYLWSVVMAYRVNDWFPGSVSEYFRQPWVVGIALFFGVTTVGAALQYMTFAAAHHHILRLRGVAVPWLAAAAWVAADLMRVRLFGGDPWAILGYSQVGVLPLMQVADVAGVHGITFLVIATNATIATFLSPLDQVSGWRSRVWPSLILGGALLVVLAYGRHQVRSISERGTGSIASVGLVQAHLTLGSQWKRSFYGRNLDAYLAMSLDVLRSEKAQLLVWPENALTFFLADEPLYRRAIAQALRPFGAQLVTGGPYTTNEDTYFNSAFLLSPEGDILGRYDKQHLLPFAERFPFGRIDVLQRNFGRIREFTPGEDRRLLDTAAGRAGVVICNEGFLPEPAAERVRAGAELLINLSNDSWLGVAKYSEPAFDMVTLRAVEQRRWIIRASTAGPSALIDPVGRVTRRTALFTATTIAGKVQARSDITLYGRLGDAFAWACVAAACVGAGMGYRRSRKRSHPRPRATTSDPPALPDGSDISATPARSESKPVLVDNARG